MDQETEINQIIKSCFDDNGAVIQSKLYEVVKQNFILKEAVKQLEHALSRMVLDPSELGWD